MNIDKDLQKMIKEGILFVGMLVITGYLVVQCIYLGGSL
jgi:hypothetical protein